MLSKFSQIALGLALAGQVACSDSNFIPGEGAHHRGSDEFKAFLRLGQGASHPAVSQSGGRLGLRGSQEGIVQLSTDPASETWSWVTFDTRISPLIIEKSDLESFARDYVASHRVELGLPADQLATIEKTLFQPLPGNTIVTFTRSFQGRPVKGAFVQFIFSDQAEGGFRLSEILNRSYGEIKVSGESKAPDSQSAIEKTGIAGLEITSSQDLIFPKLNASGTYDFRYGTEFTLIDPAQSEHFLLTVDNTYLDIMEASSNHIYAKHEILANTYTRSYVLNDAKPRPLAFVGIRDAANVVIEADGKGVLETTATTATINLMSEKSHTGIVDMSIANNTNFYSFNVALPAAGGKTTINLNQADPAALNVYMAVHELVEYLKPFYAGVNVPLLTNGIQANVNLPDPQNLFCNAFYNGASINFFRAGGGCANTGLLNEVVYHEWGHALDNNLGIVTTPNGIVDGAFSEGIGDIVSFLMTGESVVGIGFELNNANSSVRNTENTIKHPPANAQEALVHNAGRIISGAFWDLRQSLIALHGPVEGARKTTELFTKHLTMTDRYIDSYQSVLRLDDTDGNAATRSSNYCAINKAFAAHGLTGDVVETDACIDVDQGIKVRVDLDRGEGKLDLFASAFAADSIIACPGKVTSCPESTPGAVVFAKDEGTNNLNGTKLINKQFYQGKATLTTKAEADVFTFFSRDASGKMLGLKTLRFKPRDQASDLSSSLQ